MIAQAISHCQVPAGTTQARLGIAFRTKEELLMGILGRADGGNMLEPHRGE